MSEEFEYHLLHLFDVAVADAHSKGNTDEASNEKYRQRRQALLEYVARLEARQSAILAAFDAHCVAWEIEGPHDLYLGGDLHEGVNETFAALYHVIKEKGE
jgi:hypothetical protein